MRSLFAIGALLVATLFVASSSLAGGPAVGGPCDSDADCRSPRKCGCDVRLSCSFLKPGSFYVSGDGGRPTAKPGRAGTRCMTLEEAADALAVKLVPNRDLLPSGIEVTFRMCAELAIKHADCDAGCDSWIPACHADAECPKGQICVCRGPACSIQERVTFYGPAPFLPPYSTFMCMPPPDAGSLVTY